MSQQTGSQRGTAKWGSSCMKAAAAVHLDIVQAVEAAPCDVAVAGAELLVRRVGHPPARAAAAGRRAAAGLLLLLLPSPVAGADCR